MTFRRRRDDLFSGLLLPVCDRDEFAVGVRPPYGLVPGPDSLGSGDLDGLDVGLPLRPGVGFGVAGGCLALGFVLAARARVRGVWLREPEQSPAREAHPLQE